MFSLLAMVASSLMYGSLNLENSYDLALKRSEHLGGQAELVRQARARYFQAVGAILPNVKAAGTWQWQEETSGTTSSTTFDNTSPQKTYKLTATLPFFRGGREWFGLSQASALERAQRATEASERLKLYEETALSFFQIFTLRKELENSLTQKEIFEKRVLELEKRRRIGRSRSSEVLTTESTLASLRGEVASLQGQLQAEIENFKFLTGVQDQPDLEDSVKLPEKLEVPEAFLKNLASKPEVLAQEEKYNAARQNARGSWGQHLPSGDLSGNYYFKRPGSAKDVNWDIRLDLSIPILEGGSTQAKINEAQAAQRSAELDFISTRREAERDIRALHQELKAQLEQVTELFKARDLSDRSAKDQMHQYDLGLVSNLDVLQAINSKAETASAYERAYYSAKLNWIKLEIASGRRKDTPAQ